MNLATPQIPPSEWEHWKPTILRLIQDHTLKEVKDIMLTAHDFRASKWQYEKQLRTWRTSKYITQDAWAIIFETVDRLRSQDQESRILVNGKLDEPKLRRARARQTCYKKISNSMSQRNAKGVPTGLGRLSIETKGLDGKWSPFKLDFFRNSTCIESSSPRSPCFLSNKFSSVGQNFGENSSYKVDDKINFLGVGKLLQDPNTSNTPGIQDLDMDIVEEIPLLINTLETSPLMAPIQVFSPRDLQQSDCNNYELASWDLTDWIPTDWAKSPTQIISPMVPDVYQLTRDLPFSHFIEDFEANGISMNFGRITPFTGAHSLLIQNPVRLFLTDIFSCISESIHDNLSISSGILPPRQTNVEYLLSPLKSLLPNEKPPSCNSTGQNLVMRDEMLQLKLNHILLFSTANGFAGLHDIPIQSILKYLNRYGAISFQIQGKHSHIRRALAENLFRAAIEAKDKHSLRNILAISSVDVNSTICNINGGRYTPLERAVIHQDLGTVQLIINAGADVNKTFGPKGSEGRILSILFNNLRLGTNIAPAIVEIGKMLLDAGAKVDLPTIRHAIEGFHLPGLAYDLISNVSDADHSIFIRRGYLSTAVAHLADWQATNTFRHMVMACERTNCHRCLTDYKDELDWAFIQSVKHGHLQLIQLFQLHCKTPHRAFSAAIRCGRKEVIDVIRSLRPDLNAPAHSIDDKVWSLRVENHYEDSTTSLAEAIRAGNEELLHMIEDAGHLFYLHEGERFQPAISAASARGDVEYVRKLLRYCPAPEPSHMYYAALEAVQRNDEEILFTLLNAGADVNLGSSSRQRPPEPLLVAIRQQNRRMVHAILNADVDPKSGTVYYRSNSMEKERTILEEAIKWADRSIIQAILSTIPIATLKDGDEIVHVLEQGDIEFFDYLLDTGTISASTLNKCLEAAISICDAELIRTLIEKGANPIDPDVLEMCAEKHPNMLKLLLELSSLGKSRRVVPGFGTDALSAAIKCGQSGFEAVRVLLDSGIIDFKSFVGATIDDLTRRTPLGVAIKWSQKGTHGNYEMIRKLLDQGRCDPDCIVSIGWSAKGFQQTAFLDAIETRDIDLVELMLNHNANVNREAEYGLKRTPLQKAVEVGSLEIVTLLLNAKADVNGSPSVRGGATALQLAAITGNCNIAATLLAWGADLHASPSTVSGRWPLEGAAEHGRIEMIYFLWRASGGFDLDQCQKAMDLAEENGYLPCRDVIAELASVNIANMPAITI